MTERRPCVFKIEHVTQLSHLNIYIYIRATDYTDETLEERTTMLLRSLSEIRGICEIRGRFKKGWES